MKKLYRMFIFAFIIAFFVSTSISQVALMICNLTNSNKERIYPLLFNFGVFLGIYFMFLFKKFDKAWGKYLK